ncbi:MAG: LysM peptidoglycan-binding domain-containing protein [Phycisphaerales bacterium]|nr:LysM peptidoglycan-binding domain-containing protein [Phycisphaerales bacterium]
MAMNFRAAVFLSGAFITALCMTVYYNRSPIIEGMALAGEGDDSANRPSNVTQRRGLPSVDTPRFAVNSPVESEIANNRSKPRILTAVAPDAESPRQGQVSLPPLLNNGAVRAPEPHNQPLVSQAEFVANDKPQPAVQSDQGREDQVLLAGHKDGGAAGSPPSAENAVVYNAQSDAESGVGKTYVVRSGDNLAKIAKRELNSNSPAAIAAIVAVNPKLKGRADKIIVGQKLMLPDLRTPNGGVELQLAGVATAKDTTATPTKTDRAMHLTKTDEARRDAVNAQQSGARAKTDLARESPGRASRKASPASKQPAVAKTTQPKSKSPPGAGNRAPQIADSGGRSRADIAKNPKGSSATQVAAAAGRRTNVPASKAGLKALNNGEAPKPKDAVASKTPSVGADTMKLAGAPSAGSAKRAPGNPRNSPSPSSRSTKREVAAGTNDREKTAGLQRVSAR